MYKIKKGWKKRYIEDAAAGPKKKLTYILKKKDGGRYALKMQRPGKKLCQVALDHIHI
jgi:hypothetical protein